MGSQRVGHDWAAELNWTASQFCNSQDFTLPAVPTQDGIFHTGIKVILTSTKSWHISKIFRKYRNQEFVYSSTSYLFTYGSRDKGVYETEWKKTDRRSLGVLSKAQRLCAQSCVTLCEPMDCSPPGSSVHGISQARILEGAAISCPRGSSGPWNLILVSCISCISRQILLTLWHLGSPSQRLWKYK